MPADLESKIKKLNEELESIGQNPDLQAIQDLETRAQFLLRDTTGAPQLQENARILLEKVMEIRRKLNTNNISASPEEIPMLLNKARVRIQQSSTLQDWRNALGHLQQVLDIDSGNDAALNLIEELLNRAPDLQESIKETLSPFRNAVPRAADILNRLDSSRSYNGNPATFYSPQSTDEVPTKLVELMNRMTDLYYKGEYHEAINLCNEILTLDPNNTTAKEYRLKADDYLKQGYVPDTRIPLQARTAYNRALSAKRAGMYKEAQVLLNNALQIAQENHIEHWADVVNILTEIEDLVLAKDLEEEGDKLAQQDHWDEALLKYEGALDLANFPRTRKKYEALISMIQSYREVTIQISTLSGSLISIAEQLQDIRKELGGARGYWTESVKLSELWARVEGRSRDISMQLQRQGQELLQKAQNARAVDECVQLINDARRHLEAVHDLSQEDLDVSALLVNAINEENRAQSVKRLFDDAEQAINQSNEAGINIALGNLQNIANDSGNYTQDPRYRNLLTRLHRSLIDQVERELSNRPFNVDSARGWLEKSKRGLFNSLGHNAEISVLEKRLEKKEKELHLQQLKPAILSGVAILIFVFLLFVSREAWYPIINPSPTATPIATVTPSNTPTFTASPTLQTELCRGVTKGGSQYYVYINPDRTSTKLGTVPPNWRVNVLDQTRDNSGDRWFKIDYGDQDTTQIGWIPAEFVIEATDCPRLD